MPEAPAANASLLVHTNCGGAHSLPTLVMPTCEHKVVVVVFLALCPPLPTLIAFENGGHRFVHVAGTFNGTRACEGALCMGLTQVAAQVSDTDLLSIYTCSKLVQ